MLRISCILTMFFSSKRKRIKCNLLNAKRTELQVNKKILNKYFLTNVWFLTLGRQSSRLLKNILHSDVKCLRAALGTNKYDLSPILNVLKLDELRINQ